MYNDDEERRSFPLRDFILKLILIVIFVLLLVWLLPIPNLDGLNNKIFSANVGEMKDAAITYFTTERLPQKEGDSVTLTLQEMLDMKLLLPFKDKNGDACDTRNSYVKLTKMENEYEMRVHLKCNEEEDYIIVHLGCYSYCTQAICEKEEEKEVVVSKPSGGPSCQLEISSGKKGSNGWYVGDVVVKFKSKKTTTSGASISAYGIGTSTTYNKKTTYKVTKDGSTKVYGYVKDSKGKTAVCSITVKKDTKKPSCNLAVLSGTKNNEGQYITNVKVGFNSKTDSTSGIASYGLTTSSKETYNSSKNYTISKNGSTKVYGYVKDKAGHKAVCNITVTKVAVEEDKYSEPSCSLKVAGTKGNNNWYISDVVVSFKTKKSTNGANITSYGIGTSSKANYNSKNSHTLNTDGSRVIYGYVKDSKGNTAVCSVNVNRDATKPNCNLAIQSGTYNSGGYYTSKVVIGFKLKEDATSGINSYGIGKSTTYSNNEKYTISTNGTHMIYGYIKDNAGNTNVCKLQITKKDITYEYEYLKTWDNEYSNWSEWTTKTYDPKNPPKFGTTDTKVTEDLGSTKEFDKYVYSVGKAIYGDKLVESASMTQKVCKGYNYYRTSKTSTTTYAVKVGSGDGWTYLKTITAKEQPKDSLSVKYVMAGWNYSKCDTNCSSTPYKLFKVYTREVAVVTASDTITTSTGVKVKCSEYETKTTYTFDIVPTVIGYEEIRTAQYKDVYKYRYKTRDLTKEAGSSRKWSTIQNDATLIDQGYKMTGNKRVKG